MKPVTGSPHWWKDAIIYQIWPASYKDSDGDGLGDIPGIISTLDYVKDLGVNTIWLSPHYASPQVDMGYDISDYEDVYRPYGTVADVDRLIKGTHDRGMRIIFDLVINHTSDQHAWFTESRKSKNNSKHDWYIWRDPKIVNGERRPPNNWRSFFESSAWEYVEERGQYYLHLFAKEQPDVNWECDAAREAVYESAIRFWLRKGVDGFRVDTANIYCKDQSFPDANYADPNAPPPFDYFANGPRMHEWYQTIRSEVLDEFGDIVMIGEFGPTPHDELMRYISEESRELSMVLDMEVVMLGGNWTVPKHDVRSGTLPELKKAFMKIQRYVTETNAWASVFLSNHDQPRSISRFGTEEPRYREQSGKALAILLSTLSGTMLIYQGEEIGMTNVPQSWSIEDMKDVDALNYWRTMQEQYPNDEEMLRKAWLGIRYIGRDNARTPVQWDASKNAGFTTGEPWMRVNPNHTEINVAAQLADSNSLLHFWRQMLHLRKQHAELFVYGRFHVHDVDNEQVFMFEKQAADGTTALVMLNFSSQEAAWTAPLALEKAKLELLVTNVVDGAEKLRPWEGRVYLVPKI